MSISDSPTEQQVNVPFELLEVALPVPLDNTFDYLLPSNTSNEKYKDLEPGVLIHVPFGPRSLMGVLLQVKVAHAGPSTNVSSNEPNKGKYRAAHEIIEKTPVFTPELLKICRWLSHYYHHPLGEVLAAAMPPKMRNYAGLQRILKKQKHTLFEHTTEGLGLNFDALKRSPKQQTIHQYLLENTYFLKSNVTSLGFSSASIKALIDKGIILQKSITPKELEARQDPHKHSSCNGESLNSLSEEPQTTMLKEAPRTLTTEQSIAKQKIQFHQFNTYLVDGVTGSGKTEIYLQLAQRALATGKQVLILIPEIGLSPQTIGRFKDRFQIPVAELHSNISEAKRADQWLRIKSGEARIIVGTRLAALSPFKDLGLIIIDEEHDTSYKQTEGLRYSARDLSIYRAHQLNIPIILGTATPSLESLHHARRQKYTYLQLNERATGAKAPTISIVNVCQAYLQGGLSETSISSIRDTIERGEQALVFVNRRGFASIIQCHSCGWVAQCQSCDHRLTLHMQDYGLLCHQCDRHYSVPNKCLNCNATDIHTGGFGTEQTEALLSKIFPNTNILRVDRDSTRRKDALAKTVASVNEGEACILIGTQMLAKGHHFPRLSLVVIADADQGLMSSDFRGPERMGQQIIQVAGRAGRHELPGKVIVQTHNPDHPLMRLLVNQGYRAFASELLSLRQHAAQPPFSFLAIFRCEDQNPELAMTLLNALKDIATKGSQGDQHLKAIGPVPDQYERVNNRFRFQLRMTHTTRPQLHSAIHLACIFLRKHKHYKRLRWSVDVDPVSD